MLLSTPAFVTHASEAPVTTTVTTTKTTEDIVSTPALPASSDTPASSVDANKASRAARQADNKVSYDAIKSSLVALSKEKDALEKQITAFEDTLISQKSAVEAELASSSLGSTTQLNSSDESNELKDMLKNRTTHLTSKVEHLKSCIKELNKEIKEETNNSKKQQSAFLSATGDRQSDLQNQVSRLNKCIADKTTVVAKLQAKLDAAQASLQKLATAEKKAASKAKANVGSSMNDQAVKIQIS